MTCGRRLAKHVLGLSAVLTLGLAFLAAPADAQSRFTHGECLANQTHGAVPLDKRKVCDPAAAGYDARYFSFNPLSVYVAPSSRWEQGGGHGPNLFNMSLSVYCKEKVAIGWRTRDATATAGSDYTAVSGATHVFEPGIISAQCAVDTMDDQIAEPDETFEIVLFELSEQTHSTVCDGTTLCTEVEDTSDTTHLCILDDEPGGGQSNPLCDFGQTEGGNPSQNQENPWVTVLPTSLTVTEGDTAGDTYTVVLTTQPTGTVTVAVGGYSGTDVRVDRSSVSFSTQNWNQHQTVNVTAVHDNDADPDSPVTLTHTANGGGYNNVGADEVTVTITEDDTVSDTIQLSISTDQVREGGGSQRLTVTGALNGVPTGNVTTVTLTVGGGTASSSDYSASGATLTVGASATSGSATVTITPVNDTMDEDPDETVIVSATTTSSLSLSPSSFTVTIIDDDGPATGIDLTTVPSRLAENARQQSVTVTAALTGGGARITPTTVNLSVVGRTATTPADYTVSGVSTVTIPADQLSGTATFTLTVVDDPDPEPAETLEVQGTDQGSPALPVDPATITIEANDGGGRGGGGGGGSGSGSGSGSGGGSTTRSTGGLQLIPRDARASEGAGRMVFTVDLSSARTSPVSVRWRTADRTATSGNDYPAASGTLTIPSGARFGRIEIQLRNDLLDEPDETFAIQFSEARGAGLADTEAIGTILDDDAEPALMVGDASAPEGDGRIGFFVWLASDSGRTVTVNYATRGVSATPDTDYRPASGTLSIPPGSAGETLWVSVLDDQLDEEHETLEMVLSRPRYATAGDLLAVGTIEDDDAEPQPLVPNVTVAERAGGMQFVVTLDAISGKQITWDFVTVDGSATAEADYSGRTGTLSFAPGERRRTLPIAIVNDLMDEVDEDFRLSLTNPREPSSPAVEAIAVIVDDDDNAIVVDAWISRFGRTVASQVVDAVGGRFAGMGGPGSHFLLGGDPFRSTLAFAGVQGYRRGEPRWMENASDRPGAIGIGLDPARILSGSSFVYSGQDDEQPAGRGFEGRWTAWGRGSLTHFDGADPGVTLGGEVLNVTAGADVQSGAVLVGLALSGSHGAGDFHVARTGVQSERMGGVRSILGSLHPYAHVSLAEWLQVWGLGGYGTGRLEISGSEQDSDLRMKMWAFGGRSELPAGFLGGFGLALKSDVFWVEMESDPTDVRRGSIAEAQRLRFMLESSFRVVSLWGGELSPLLEAGFRQDDGDAETGQGLEVASGVRYSNADRGLFFEATARSLVSHEDERYREWGVGGALRLDPGPDYRGLAVQINSSHGVATSSVQRLWSDPGAVAYFPGMARGRHEAEVGYGFRALQGGAMVIPFSGVVYSPSGAKSVRVGSRLRVGSRWMLSLQADRSQYGLFDPWYGVVLRGHLLPEMRVSPSSGGEHR